MRVTAGKFKGRNLIDNKFEHIRPTADMVKQAVFNKLQFCLNGARVLDLCAGTGALGIEALSRGAKEVVFVDKDARSCTLIKQNLAKLGVEAKVVKIGAIEACEILKDQKFDIILFDPPYKSELYEKVVDKLAETRILADEGVLVVEQAKEDKYNWNSAFEIQDEKIYGIKKITYFSFREKYAKEI